MSANSSPTPSFHALCVKSAFSLVGDQLAAQSEQPAPQPAPPSELPDSRLSPLHQERPFSPRDPALARAALANDPVSERVFAKKTPPKDGQLVGVRLNLNALKASGIAIQTLHRAPARDQRAKNKGFFRGEAIHYQEAVALANAYFSVDQSARELIATGARAKSPMASVDGAYDSSPIESLNGIEVSFNPVKTHLFTDQDGRAIRFAERVVIAGHRAYASGRVEWHTELTAPQRAEGAAPSLAKISQSAPFSPARCLR